MTISNNIIIFTALVFGNLADAWSPAAGLLFSPANPKVPRHILTMNKKEPTKRRVSTTKAKGFAIEKKVPEFPYTGSVRPGKQSPQRVVTNSNIVLPDYALDSQPKKTSSSSLPWNIEVETPSQIELMRAAGRCAREVLDIAGQAIQPGITTEQIDVYEETLKVCV